VLIDKISKATLTVGQAVIRLGRVVLSWVVDFIRTAPMVSFGLLLGAVFGALFAAIPVIGALLSPVVLPLSLALGFALTVSHELSDPNLRGRVEELVSRFAPLAAKA
jgi:predicted histidine transporter YuiF (NhaC family)